MIKLRDLREERRINQEGLAMRINVSQSTISAYEVGERTPDLETLISIAKFFDVSIDYLVGKSQIKQQLQTSDLSDGEISHLRAYRRLDPQKREKVDAYMDGLSEI